MSRQITFQPIEVLTASEDREGRLVLVDGRLAAVLVRLSDRAHEPLLRGAWYIEAGFGSLDGRHELFASLDEAIASIERDFAQFKGGGCRSVRFRTDSAIFLGNTASCF